MEGGDPRCGSEVGIEGGDPRQEPQLRIRGGDPQWGRRDVSQSQPQPDRILLIPALLLAPPPYRSPPAHLVEHDRHWLQVQLHQGQVDKGPFAKRDVPHCA